MSKTFAEQVTEARTRLGMTQSQLGAALGVTGASVSRWESGGRPEPEKLPQIIEALGLNGRDVLEGLGYGQLLGELVGPRADTELRYKRPPGLTDRQWAKVKREMADHLDYQIERASKER